MKLLTLVVPCLVSALIPLAQAQDLPAGKGKDTVEQVCGACHGTDLVSSRRATKQGWSYIVDDMVSRGASATNDQIKEINDYLTKYLGQVNVNKGASADLASILRDHTGAGRRHREVPYRPRRFQERRRSEESARPRNSKSGHQERSRRVLAINNVKLNRVFVTNR